MSCRTKSRAMDCHSLPAYCHDWSGHCILCDSWQEYAVFVPSHLPWLEVRQLCPFWTVLLDHCLCRHPDVAVDGGCFMKYTVLAAIQMLLSMVECFMKYTVLAAIQVLLSKASLLHAPLLCWVCVPAIQIQNSKFWCCCHYLDCHLWCCYER